MQLRTCILVALASSAFAGFVGSYVGAPVLGGVYSTGAHVIAAPAVAAVGYIPTAVSRSHRVDYHAKNPLVAKLATYTTPFVGAVHTAPVYGFGHRYGLGYGYGLGHRTFVV